MNDPSDHSPTAPSQPLAAKCPRCGYSASGLVGAAPICPECSAPIPARPPHDDREVLACSRAWSLIPTALGALAWTMLSRAPFALASQYSYEPFRSPGAWIIWTVTLAEWTLVLSGLVFIRRLMPATPRGPGFLLAAIGLQVGLPLLLLAAVLLG